MTVSYAQNPLRVFESSWLRFSCVSFLSFVSIGVSLFAQVSSSRLTTNATDGGNWLMYSGAYTSQRFSPLDQISASNIKGL